MRDTAWLIFTKNGLKRMAKGKRVMYGARERPALDAGEYAVRVSVTIPDAVFAARPIPEASIVVPESAIIEPNVIVEVQEGEA